MNPFFLKSLFVMTSSLLTFAATPLISSFTVVESGIATADIVLPNQPTDNELLAAQELVEHIEKMTGTRLDIHYLNPTESLTERPQIRIGRAAPETLNQKTIAQGNNPSAFTLHVASQTIDIRGLEDEGTLFGVYELLEQAGVRWFHPGELGTDLPTLTTLKFSSQLTTQVPSFDQRTLQHITEGDWQRRARLGGLQRSTGAHGILPFYGTRGDALFETNPEVYALVNDQRSMSQICVGNPETLRLAIESYRAQLAQNPTKYIGMGPNDGGGYCECPLCQALDGTVVDPFYNQISMTDRYIWFFNQILKALEDEYPDLHIVTYIYARHMFPPNSVTPNPRIVAVFAPITLDRIRGMDNPMSPDRHILHDLIDQWSQFKLNEMYYRGYYNNLACVALPISQVDRIRHETPVFREKGINVMRVEVIAPSWAHNTESLYLATRMMWNTAIDVDAVLNDFYQRYYGPAAEVMKRYHQALDQAFTDTPWFSGGSWPYLAIFDTERRNQMRTLLDQAAPLAESSADKYQQRLHAVRMGWDRMELFLDAIHSRNQLDFATAEQKSQRFKEISKVMADALLETASDPRLNQAWLSPRQGPDYSGNYFDRFWYSSIQQGYERTVQNGKLLYAFPDEWQALLDFVNIGELAGYWRPVSLGGNWQPLKTLSQTWSDQGFHYYRGHAWYRHQFDAPKDWKDLQVYLWIGGVAGTAKVWLNGQLLGTSLEPMEGIPGVPGSFRPFDMNASLALKYEETNTLVIQVDSSRLAEMGIGGITAPVMLWTPKTDQ